NSAVTFARGNGDGTFQPTQSLPGGLTPLAVAVGDVGSRVTLPDGTFVLGPPDGRPDLIVAASGLPQTLFFGPPEVVVLPGMADAQGRFAGFGDGPLHLATASIPQDVDIGDVNRDGALDVVVMDREGRRVGLGQRPVWPSGDPDLGTVVHVVEPTLTIVPGHEDQFYTLTAPTEDAHGSGDEVIDFSGLFQVTEGAGIDMEVRDAAGNLL